MTWPSPNVPLPTDRLNSTPQFDDHVANHNTTNLTINDDIVPEINRIADAYPDSLRTFTPTLYLGAEGFIEITNVIANYTQNGRLVTANCSFDMAGLGYPDATVELGHNLPAPHEYVVDAPMGTATWIPIADLDSLRHGNLVYMNATQMRILPWNSPSYVFDGGSNRYKWTVTYLTNA